MWFCFSNQHILGFLHLVATLSIHPPSLSLAGALPGEASFEVVCCRVKASVFHVFPQTPKSFCGWKTWSALTFHPLKHAVTGVELSWAGHFGQQRGIVWVPPGAERQGLYRLVVSLSSLLSLLAPWFHILKTKLSIENRMFTCRFHS